MLFKIEKAIDNIYCSIQSVKNVVYQINLQKKHSLNPLKIKLGYLIDLTRYNLTYITEALAAKNLYEVTICDYDELNKINHYSEGEISELMILYQSLSIQICNILNSLSNSDLRKKVLIEKKSKNVLWIIEMYISELNSYMKKFLNISVDSANRHHLSYRKIFTNYFKKDSEYINVLNIGDMEIGFYKPNAIDNQEPHLKDEIYVIINGESEFRLGTKNILVRKNDIIFVKAGEDHCFFNFTEDFSTWVIFYGLNFLR